jgi:peptide deformylase
MEIKLVKENDEVLRKVAEPWDFEKDGDPTELVRNMARIMIENNGIGLAATQVGISKRIFIMGNQDKLVACINPEIVDGSGEVMDQEGCLSFPDLWLHVKRNDFIKVKYYNAMGVLVETEFTGLISRVFQHERDHLDGICYDTRVGKLSLEFAKNRRKKRKVKAYV